VNRSRNLFPALALVVTAACGGSSSPSRPSDLEPAAPGGGSFSVVVLDGWTDRALEAQVSPADPAPGTVVTVTAPGYLTRQQAFDGSPIALWPGAQSYTDRLVYGWDWQDGSRRLVRWERPFTVSLDAPLASDGAVVARLEQVLADIRARTGLQVTLAAAGDVTIGIDPALDRQNAVGEANISTRGSAIVSARVRLVSRDEFFGDARSNSPHTLLHELGHVVGLSHSGLDRDVMAPGGGARSRTVTFTDDEATSLHMMYAHRQAGNQPVDRAPGVGAAAARDEVLSIVD
jgi:hypothetical protein